MQDQHRECGLMWVTMMVEAMMVWGKVVSDCVNGDLNVDRGKVASAVRVAVVMLMLAARAMRASWC